MVCIDAHAHLALQPGAADRLLQSMDRHGIDRTIVVGGGLMSPQALSHRLHGSAPKPEPEVSFDNRAFLDVCQSHAPRLLPFYFANPWAGVAEYEEVGSAFEGLKLAPAIHGMPLDHLLHRAFYAAAETFEHPVYLHCLVHRGYRVEDLVTVARRNPRVRFILGHAGIGNLDFMAVDLVQDLPNVLFETSGGFQAVIVHAVKTLGASRVLFGSEYPLQDAASELLKIDNLPLSPAEVGLIRGGNAEALLARGNDVR